MLYLVTYLFLQSFFDDVKHIERSPINIGLFCCGTTYYSLSTYVHIPIQ